MNKFLKYPLLVLLFHILLLAMLGLVILSTVKFKVLNPYTYINVLEENNGYEKIRNVFISSMQEQRTITSEERSVIDNFNNIVQAVITNDYAKSQIDTIILNFFNYINSDANQLELRFDLKPLKEKSKTEVGKTRPLIASKQEQLEAESNTEFMMKEVPDYYTLNLSDNFIQKLDKIRQGVTYLDAMLYILLVVITLLMIGAYLVCDTFYGWNRFIGGLLLITGIIVYVPLIIASQIGANFLNSRIDNRVLSEILGKTISDTLDFARILSAILIIIGIVMIIASALIKRVEMHKIKRIKKKTKMSTEKHSHKRKKK